MQYHISKNGAQLGSFSEAEVRQKLANGEISSSDLAWYEGLSEWKPLGTLLPNESIGAPPIPATAPANPYSAPKALFESGPAPAATGQKTTSGLAIGSMICGILGFVTCITSLPAVIMGHIALSQIKKSGSPIGGRGMAITGLVTGYLILALFPIAMVASFVVPTFNLISSQADQMKAANNCKQIQMLLMTYAADNNGLYPDSVPSPASGSLPLTSNEAFRTLFQEGLTTEEKLFGCPNSRYTPDGNIGSAPAFDQALIPGENHWAMTAGLSNTSPSLMPVVFENPAETTWPPQWNADAAGKPTRGRAWAGGKIIFSRNDGSVETAKLTSARGIVPVRPDSKGVDPFTIDGQEHKVLDIAAP